MNTKDLVESLNEIAVNDLSEGANIVDHPAHMAAIELIGLDVMRADVRRLTDENAKLKREVDMAEKQSLDFYVEKENAALTSNRAMLNAEATRLTNTIIERNKKIDLRGDNITKLLAERDAMRNKLDEWDEWSIRFKEWGNAYPLHMFPEVEDWVAVREALQKDGLTIDRVSTSCMRHVITTLINMLPIPQGGAEGEG